MAPATDTKRQEILSAAFSQFSQYGFRKTSMDDIAKATGISRASLYTYFENKEEIFRSACISINDQTLEDVEQRLKAAKGSLAARVEEALLARYGRLLEITQSPHAAEIYDENNRLCGDLVQESAVRMHELLTAALKAGQRNGEIDLKTAGLSAAAAAELIQLGAAGLKHGAPDVAAFKKRLKGFVRVFFAGLSC